MFHVKQCKMFHVKPFSPVFFMSGGCRGADWRGGGWRRQKRGAVGGDKKGGRLAAAHRAAVDSSQGGGMFHVKHYRLIEGGG